MKTKNHYSKLKQTLAMLGVLCFMTFYSQDAKSQAYYFPLEEVTSLQGLIDVKDWRFCNSSFTFVSDQNKSLQKIRFNNSSLKNSDSIITQKFYFTSSNVNPSISFDLKVNRGGYTGDFIMNLLDEDYQHISTIQSHSWKFGNSFGIAATYSFNLSPSSSIITQNGFYRIALIFENMNTGNGTSTNFDIMSFSVPIDLLPVTYSHYTAVQMLNHVVLNWSTLNETNNSHFEIEQSMNGEQWNTLGIVQGAGNSHELNVYEFIDVSPVTGTNYYRLKQVDFNGDFNYSELKVVIIGTALTEKITVYPNPAMSFINIDIPDEVDFVKAEIRSIDGRIIENKEFQNQTQATVSISHLTPGIYYLHIQLGDQLIVKSFVKQ